MRLVRTHVVQNKGNFFCSFEAKRFVLERFRVWKKIHSIRASLCLSLPPPPVARSLKLARALAGHLRPAHSSPYWSHSLVSGKRGYVTPSKV